MELHAIRSLCSLAETHSLSETARLVHLTPAAIHKQLKQLEHDLSVRLYEKSNQGLLLTAAALEILPYLRAILAQHSSALSVLDQWKGLQRGLLRIGAGPSLASDLLPPILLSYHAQRPSIDIDLQTGTTKQLLSALENGTLDVAVLVSGPEPESPAFRLELEQNVELFVVSSLDGLPRKSSVRSLARFPFLLFRRGTRMEAIQSSFCSQWNFQPQAIMRFDNPSTAKAVLLGKTGVAMLPSYTVAAEIKSGLLQRIHLREPSPRMTIRFLSYREAFVAPAVQAFLESVKAAL
jgi:DNA-binding transcriptional LysR family regulator